MAKAAGMVRGLKGRLDAWDVLSLLFVLLFLALILVNHSLYPVFLDAPYHMAVTRGFREAGGVTTWDFWDYAPEGGPHLYPPLLHVGMSFLEDLGLSPEATATLVCMAMFPLIMLALWWAMRSLFGSRTAFFSLLLLSVPGVFLWQTGVTIAASLVLVLSPLVLLAVEKERRRRPRSFWPYACTPTWSWDTCWPWPSSSTSCTEGRPGGGYSPCRARPTCSTSPGRW